MRKRGDFEFLPHFCKHCGQPIKLVKKRIWQYESRGYPQCIQGHQKIGIHLTPEHIEKVRQGNLKFAGKRYPNSGSFKVGWRKRLKEISKELLKPEITPETKQILLTEQDKIKIALERLEEIRLQKVKEFEAKPKPVSKNGIRFGMKMCILDGKLKQCKKPKAFCSHWEFCNPKKVK